MPWKSLSESLEKKPLVLAGPILRKATGQSVTVWLALKRSCMVQLHIYDTGGTRQLSGQRSTVEIGAHLHIVAVTAAELLPQSTGLTPGHIYSYDLIFIDASSGIALGLAVATNNALLTYEGLALPSFCLPPADINKLRIIHGSCRKPHGEGPDALVLLDDLLLETRHQPDARPHQLLLTGDQIYADDVAAGLLTMVSDAARTLLGWGDKDEVLELPLMPPGFVVLPHMVPPFQRNYALGVSGFTSDAMDAHLMSLGEYVCMYLFAWSGVLWSDGPATSNTVEVPTAESIVAASSASRAFAPQPPKKDGVCSEPEPWQTLPDTLEGQARVQKQIRRQNVRLTDFHSNLWRVRRALANVPSYMIFDDHEITDDWNMEFKDVVKIHSSPLGRRIVQNGLTAYALCQHWGNVPEQFANDGSSPPGAKLLTLLDKARGPDYVARSTTIAGHLGLPTADQITAKRKLIHGPDALTYHYTVQGPSHTIIVSDSRTWREFPAVGGSVLIPADVLVQQFSGPVLGQNQVLLVVLSTNAPPIRSIRTAEYWESVSKKGAHHPDVNESWPLPSDATDRLFKAISNRLPEVDGFKRGSVVLLSGDVHHSFATRLAFRGRTRFEDPADQPKPVNVVYAQLVSSAFRNADNDTRQIHRQGHDFKPGAKSVLVPSGRTERMYGWNVAPGERKEVGQELRSGQVGGVPTAYTYPVYRTRSGTEGTLFRSGQIISRVPFTPVEERDWTYRLDYLHPDLPPLQPGPAPALIDGSTAAARRESGRQHHNLARAYRLYNNSKQGRQEVVGVNSVSQVTFEWPPGDEKAAVHTMFWERPGQPDPLRFTTIRVDLHPERRALEHKDIELDTEDAQ